MLRQALTARVTHDHDHRHATLGGMPGLFCASAQRFMLVGILLLGGCAGTTAPCAGVSCAPGQVCVAGVCQSPDQGLTDLGDGSARLDHSWLPADAADTLQADTAKATEFAWKTGAWGACSVSCGGGQRSRTVTCWNVTDDKAAQPSDCPAGTKPSTTGACNTQACPDCQKIAAARAAWIICIQYDPVKQQCEGLYTDGSSCADFCAPAGLKCKEKWGSGETCSSKETNYDIGCGVNAGHMSDWCVCGP